MLKKIIYTLIAYNKIISTDLKEQECLSSCIKHVNAGEEVVEMSNYFYFQKSTNVKNKHLQKQLFKNSNNKKTSHFIFESYLGDVVGMPKNQEKNSMISEDLNYSSLIKEKSESTILSLNKGEEGSINNIIKSNNSFLSNLESSSPNKQEQQSRSSKSNIKVHEYSKNIIKSLEKDNEDSKNNIHNSLLESFELLIENKEEQHSESSDKSNLRDCLLVSTLSSREIENSSDLDAPLSYVSLSWANSCSNSIVPNFSFSSAEDFQGELQNQKFRNSNQNNLLISQCASYNCSALPNSLVLSNTQTLVRALPPLSNTAVLSKVEGSSLNPSALLNISGSSSSQFLSRVEDCSGNFQVLARAEDFSDSSTISVLSSTQVLPRVEGCSSNSKVLFSSLSPLSNIAILSRVEDPSISSNILVSSNSQVFSRAEDCLANAQILPNISNHLSNSPSSFNFETHSFIEISEDFQQQQFKEENNKKNIDLNDQEYLKELTGNVEGNISASPSIVGGYHSPILSSLNKQNQAIIQNQLESANKAEELRDFFQELQDYLMIFLSKIKLNGFLNISERKIFILKELNNYLEEEFKELNNRKGLRYIKNLNNLIEYIYKKMPFIKKESEEEIEFILNLEELIKEVEDLIFMKINK